MKEKYWNIKRNSSKQSLHNWEAKMEHDSDFLGTIFYHIGTSLGLERNIFTDSNKIQGRNCKGGGAVRPLNYAFSGHPKAKYKKNNCQTFKFSVLLTLH